MIAKMWKIPIAVLQRLKSQAVVAGTMQELYDLFTENHNSLKLVIIARDLPSEGSADCIERFVAQVNDVKRTSGWDGLILAINKEEWVTGCDSFITINQMQSLSYVILQKL